jgi:hypothetical protein
VAGSKKTNTGGVRDSQRQTEQNGAYSNKGDQGPHKQSMKPGGETVPTGNNKTGKDVGWSKINGKRHVESTNITMEDGMEHYIANVGYVEVIFMCGDGKGFNVTRGIKQFIATSRAIDKYFCLLPLGGQYNNLCIPADVPNSKEGIKKYFQHRVSVNNVAGSIKIQTKFSISQLKHPSSFFANTSTKKECISTVLSLESRKASQWAGAGSPIQPSDTGTR